MPPKVLVVEDDDLIRQLVEMVLDHHGLEVHGAPDARTGLEMARALLPDLILMDIQMPGMDGLEATRQIRATPDLAATPVVVLTGHVTEQHRTQALEAGCSAFLGKPVTAAEIMQVVGRFLPRTLENLSGNA